MIYPSQVKDCCLSELFYFIKAIFFQQMDDIILKIYPKNIGNFTNRPNFGPLLFIKSVNSPWDRKSSAFTLAVLVSFYSTLSEKNQFLT